MIDQGTKVLIYSKSTGCKLHNVFGWLKDQGQSYDLPITGWVINEIYSPDNKFSIQYEPIDGYPSGGDYYLREDFILYEEAIIEFKDEEFMI